MKYTKSVRKMWFRGKVKMKLTYSALSWHMIKVKVRHRVTANPS